MKILLRITAIIAVAAAIFWTAGFVSFTAHVAGLHAKDKSPTEAIIVLTGGPDRINRGLDLLSQNMAQYLFISGVNTQVSVNQLVKMWHEDTKDTPCCIVLGHEARNTFENATEARDWIRTNKISSARLLTTDYHMPRAWIEFTSMMPEIEFHSHPIPSKTTNIALLMAEYNKTLYTFMRVRLVNS